MNLTSLPDSIKKRNPKLFMEEAKDNARKREKYGNSKMFIEGIKFDSKKEMTRYFELRMLQALGEISDLRRQVTYQLSVCKYIADHCYKDKSGNEVVEDVKSKATRKLPVYRLKKKLMKAELNIEIKEY